MSLYVITLFAHSYLRWLVLALAIVVVARAASGFFGRRHWSSADERAHTLLVISVDLQFLIGLILYVFLSPIRQAFYVNPSFGMHDATLRFFGVEHAFGMVLAVVLIHVGRAISKRASEPRRRHGRTALLTLLALVVMLGTIPWPHAPYGRPLFRSERSISPSSKTS